MKLHPSTSLIALVVGIAAAACSDSDSSDDPRSQALSYAREDISCTATEDCCAVLDGCLAQFLIVSAQDRTRVEELLASTDDDACLACIPPVVQVDCVSGKCVGVELEPTTGSYDDVSTEFLKTHCGRIDPPAGWEPKPADQGPSAPASFQPQTVIGC